MGDPVYHSIYLSHTNNPASSFIGSCQRNRPYKHCETLVKRQLLRTGNKVGDESVKTRPKFSFEFATAYTSVITSVGQIPHEVQDSNNAYFVKEFKEKDMHQIQTQHFISP